MPQPTDHDWDLIVERLREGKCVPFLGAGASLGTVDSPGLPTASRLANALAAACGYPGEDTSDLFRVAQYFSMVRDVHALRTSVVRQLSIPDVRPGAVHKTIAALPVSLVITTNFDTLMEQAFREGTPPKQPKVLFYDAAGNRQQLPWYTPQEPVVYKLHGCMTAPRTMVVTEDDVVQFLASMLKGEPGLPDTIKSVFGETSLLFVGYGLKDWNVRVMLRAFRGMRSDLASFAIQRRPQQASLAAEWDQSVLHWDRREGLKCFDMDALLFAQELADRFQRRPA